jgi:aldose sugar dehydrogenase
LVKVALRKLASRYARLSKQLQHQITVVSLRAQAQRGSRRRRFVRAVLALFAVLGCFGLAFFAGVAAERADIPAQLSRGVEERALAIVQGARQGASDVQRASWREVVLNQHSLEWTSVRIRPDGVPGGALVEIAGHIVFASPLGRFNYLSPENELGSLQLQAPNNLEAIRQSSLVNDPLINIAEFRVHDLAARQTGPHAWELYASLSRFGGENCYQFKVVRARLLALHDSLAAQSPDWEEVYTARPGCIPNKDRGWLFQGMEAGGRMAFTADHIMLISVGDHQFDGFNDARSVAMDPGWDLGKIIELDVNTGQSRIYAMGLRNPQGLVVMRDGRIFSTEHGPQGGDEINFIREGANYGWPEVSYGMNYGFPRRAWSSSPRQGGHAGHTRPAFAFVPSIGISNLAQPSGEEFPYWGDNDLLMLSLRAGTLFHVAVHEDEVAYVEPVEFGAGMRDRERLRDIIALSDGRIAILTDSGALIFLRNAERHAGEARDFVVRGFANMSPPLPEEMLREAGARTEHGRRYFEIACASCHSLDGRPGIGPPLNGVVGRPVGAVRGYGYSAALSQDDRVWTEQLLRSYITDPSARFPGTAMPQPLMSWMMAPDIVDYLRTTH